MKPYNFSLEKVLELRLNKEKSTMENFALVQNQLRQYKLGLESLILEVENIKIKTLKTRNIHELRVQNLYKQNIDEKIKSQNELIDRTSKTLEEVRLELVAAQKDRKIMEKLKEKDFTIYMDHMKVVEQKQLDEMAMIKYKPSIERL